MDRKHLGFMFAAIAFCLVTTGCGDSNAMTEAELNKSKNSRAPSEAEMQKVREGMEKGGEASRTQQQDWAKRNPEELKRINAERAKMGRPPLGQ